MHILGLHHVTAIAADAQKNIDFYTGGLGLRLVKLTVNFDDPGSYHLYYGDELGRPGSIVTFFVWPGAVAGRIGTSQVTTIAFSVPPRSLDYWSHRVADIGIDVVGPFERMGEQVLGFNDPDGLQLELIEPDRHDPREPWIDGTIPPEHAIRGLHSVTISQEHYEQSVPLLTDILGFRRAGSHENRFRYEAAAGGAGTIGDVLSMPGTLPGVLGTGTVHHVAWRIADERQQAAWRDRLNQASLGVTPVRDRLYFRSIYFREPGSVLFEIATDQPGFTADEPRDHLGTELKLPPWLEPLRAQLQRTLPPVELPAARRAWRQGAGHGR